MELFFDLIWVSILAIVFFVVAIIKSMLYLAKHPFWLGMGYAFYLLVVYIGHQQWFKAGMAVQAMLLTALFLLPKEWEWGKHADWAKIGVFVTFCLLFVLSFVADSWPPAVLIYLPAAIATALIPIGKPNIQNR
ncbi:MAG TPA: hypothetical protein PLH37_03240 [bacterium]|nr:hypothetical protein [bacterium]